MADTVPDRRDTDAAEQYAVLRDELKKLEGLLQAIVTLLESQAAPRPTPVATYAQMYGPVAVPEGPPLVRGAAPPVPVRGWRRWFVREDAP